MHFHVINDNFYNRFFEKIAEYFPSFDSVFDKEDGVYPILGELSTFIIDNFYQESIRLNTTLFINDAIEHGGTETEDAIVVQLFQRFYENSDLANQIKVLLSDKALSVFNEFQTKYNR